MPLLNPRTPRGELLRAALPAVFCLLVFFFALHAKTAMYGGASTPKVTPSTASKLWVTGEKMQTRVIPPDSATQFVLLVAALLTPMLRREPARQPSAVVPTSHHFCLQHLTRFLRPPPARS